MCTSRVNCWAQLHADMYGIMQGLFNFKPSVRPVPLECHIQGYPGKFYCPRMATMNKPAYAAIQTHSPLKPVLVFVSSRRQVRPTQQSCCLLLASCQNVAVLHHRGCLKCQNRNDFWKQATADCSKLCLALSRTCHLAYLQCRIKNDGAMFTLVARSHVTIS